MKDRKGYSVGSYRRKIFIRDISLEKLIDKLENISNGTVVLACATPKENGFSCGIRVYSYSLKMCDDIFAQIEDF